MAHDKNNNFSINIVIYLAILNLIDNPISTHLSVLLLGIVYLISVYRSSGMILLFPFYLYPFMFLIRAQDQSSIILTFLPDLLALIAITFHFIKYRPRNSNRKYLTLLFLYAIVSLLIAMTHVGALRYLPLTFRQYVLPVIFLYTVIDSSTVQSNLPTDALRVSIISFGFVALLSLLNIFNIHTIIPSSEALYPFLNYSYLLENNELVVRGTTEMTSLPRLNLFAGGALGSAAAIFFALGLIPFLLPKMSVHWFVKMFSIFLVSASLMTSSMSVLISIAVYLVIVFGLEKKRHFLRICVGIVLFYLFSSKIFIDSSLLEYGGDTSVAGFFNYFQSIDMLGFLFGSGPRFTSIGYEFVPSLFVVDSGIFRVFIETGILNFSIYLVFLIMVFKKGTLIFGKSDIHNGRQFFFLFLVFIFLTHANMTALPPFFPLFSAVVAGIFQAHALVVRTRLTTVPPIKDGEANNNPHLVYRKII